MEANNNFSAGQNTDISKVFQNKDSYLQALNFRATTELGNSNAALVNIKGNECKVQFPTSQDIFKIKVVDLGGTTDDTVSITINGQTTSVIAITKSTTGLELYNAIKQLRNCFESSYSGPDPLLTPTFTVAYRNDYVIISQQPVYTSCSPTASIFPTTTFTKTSGSPRWTLMFETVEGTYTNTQINGSYILTNNQYRIIGSTFIDEDLYLLTADSPLAFIPEHDSFTGVGSIWKLSIDDVTRDSTLTLLYTNYLDFTVEHPVAPSAILGRYESKEIKRIYWTDFYNKIRTCNIADPQLMALDPTQLSVIPSFNFELPILQDILTGSLPVGTYELSYRLKKTIGSVTNYTQPSNMVNLVAANPNDTSASGFVAYQGSTAGNSGRSITWKLDNLDTDFDLIEFIVLHRDTKTNLATCYVLSDLTVTESKTITVSTLDNLDTIELDEFVSLQVGFNYAKTVDTKDNRLFWGNVKNDRQDISNKFDARAFRAKTPGGNDIRLTHGGVELANLTLAQAEALPVTHDAINQYYDSNGNENNDPVLGRACYYKPNDPGNKLGGKGKYIEYEFYTESIDLSDLSVTEGSSGDFNIYSGIPYSNQSGLSGITTPLDLVLGTTDSNNQLYPIKGVAATKNPYVTSALKGFQHEEIYRFGIQFFDDQGFPMFTEWIGDIKFPKYSDPNPGGPTGDFRNSYLNGTTIKGQILGIKFTVNVREISKAIGAYQIVRVERTQNDKSILATGIITQPRTATGVDPHLGGGLYYDTVPNSFIHLPVDPNPPYPGYAYRPDPSQLGLETLCPDFSPEPSDGETNAGAFVMTIDSFDFQTNGYTFKSNDKILVRSILKPVNSYNARLGVGNPRYRKSFDNGFHWLTNDNKKGTLPSYDTPNVFGIGSSGCGLGGKFQTGFDSDEMPHFIHFYVDNSFPNDVIKTIIDGKEVAAGNSSSVIGGYTYVNHMRCYGNPTLPEYSLNGIPAYGSKTVGICLSTGLDPSTYACVASTGNKFFVLYYRYNASQYGGNTYVERTNSTYIPCGSLIPIKRDNKTLANNLNISFDCFGGDIHLNYHDHQKLYKHLQGDGADMALFRYYPFDGGSASDYTGNCTGHSELVAFNMGVTYMFPCTNNNNQAVRYGNHTDTSLTGSSGYGNEQYNYANYHSNERNILTYFPKPLNFQTTDEWRARVFFSEVKFDNETQDSWSQYLPNSFYDVEGNYGGINCLITLNNQVYYIQDRAIGQLLINPVAQVDGGIGAPIQLGQSAETIQRHQNIAIDIGTKHQWSVYRSPNQFVFLDVRHKKLYSFSQEGLRPISDLYGQRNFFVKRLHDNNLINDNPIKDSGILTTYDYYHNEFLITIVNDNDATDKDEYYTLAFNELTNKFTGMYSFLPNIYLNNNRYLFSNINRGNLRTSIYLHNYGAYGNFYNTQYPSTLKVLVNDNPLYTKIFDNLVWISESIKDNLEWSDDLNITPGAVTNPLFPDDVPYPQDTFTKVRCYDQYQNTDFVNLTLTPPSNNLRKTEQGFNLQIPRNKFNYDTTAINTKSLFDTTALTKTTFGERIRDKWMIVDLYYPNTQNNRFVIHNLKTLYKVSDR